MAFCVSCGKQALTGDEFCSGCGTKLRSRSTSVSTTETTKTSVATKSSPVYYSDSQPRIGRKGSGNGRKIVAVVVIVAALAIGLAIAKTHSDSANGDDSPSYIAGWNDMAPDGSSSFGDGMSVNGACNYDYVYDGGGFNSTLWMQGCEAAGHALNNAMNTYTSVSQWTIPVK
jgi:hypothetical protein